MPLIFCLTCDTLILAAPECPACGWRRPPAVGAAGQQLWQAELGRALPKAQASAVLAGAHLCLCAEDGSIAALHLASGALAWQQPAPNFPQQRTLASDGTRLFVGAIDLQPIPTPGAALVALDPASGAELWRYPTQAHSLSNPAVDGDTVYIVSSDGQLHAVDAASGARRWALAHGSWAAEALAATGGLVVAGGRDSTLRGYSAAGAPLWRWSEGGAFAGALRLVDCTIYTCGWDGCLYVFDAQAGTLRWKLAPERGQGTTSPPAIGGGRVLVGSRVYRDPAARTGGYGLLAFDAATGAELWRALTPRHVAAPPAVAEDMVIFSADDGILRALDAATGAERWQLALGARLVTPPLLDGDTLYIGERDGTITAVRWRAQPATFADDPQAYRQRGELAQAAAAYALRGELAQAAALYAGELSQPRHAAQLYERAGQPQLAGPLWEQAGELRRAREQYEQAGSALDVARLWAAAGEPLQGARLYEQQGELERAAELYEQAGSRNKAGELYQQSGQLAEAQRIWQSLGAWERLADALIGDRQLVAAADLLAEHRQAERAADLYEQAGALTQALLQRVALEHWERVAILAQQVGNYEQAGVAYEQLGQAGPAAEAFQRAAEQLAAARPADDPGVAELYERAAARYAGALDDERAADCRRQVRRYRQQPEVIVTGGAQQVFVEHHWNTLLVRAENVGYGSAFAVDVALRGAFDVDGSATIAGLRAGEAEQIELYVRPHQGEYGPKVPLVVALTYTDAQGQRYQGAQRIPIHVVQEGAISPTTTPVEIRVEDDQLRSVVRPRGRQITQADPPSLKETTMADQEAIARQEQLLNTYRRTLAVQLHQKALLGAAYAPPGLLNGIDEARAEIARIKAVLRGWGVAVADEPNDGDAPTAAADPPATPPPMADRRALREVMVQHFSLDELATLCDDIQHTLAGAGIALRVNFEDMAGNGKEGKVRELIGYLERRGHLAYLIDAVRRERPGSV